MHDNVSKSNSTLFFKHSKNRFATLRRKCWTERFVRFQTPRISSESRISRHQTIPRTQKNQNQLLISRFHNISSSRNAFLTLITSDNYYFATFRPFQVINNFRNQSNSLMRILKCSFTH